MATQKISAMTVATVLTGAELIPIVQSGVNKSVTPLVMDHLMNVRYFGATGNGATDDTAAIQAAFDAVYVTGGTLYFPAGTYTIGGKLTILNDAQTFPRQAPIKMIGTGALMASSDNTEARGTILNMTYDGTYGKLVTNGLGLLQVGGITFKDTAGDATPFIYSTNTTLHIQHNSFIGSKDRAACDQDCIILGGETAVAGGHGLNDGFQGYGTIIDNNAFDHIRRAVYGRVFANAVNVNHNTIWGLCGSNLANGAAFEFDDMSGGTTYDCGLNMSGNMIEMTGYPYGIKLGKVTGANLITNNFYDPGVGSVACFYLDTLSVRINIISGYYSNSEIDLMNPVASPFGTVIDPIHGGFAQLQYGMGFTFNPNGGANKLEMFMGWPGAYDGYFQIRLNGSYIGGIHPAGLFSWGGTEAAPKFYVEPTTGQTTINEGTIRAGTGSPENVVTGNPGDIYMRKDGGANTCLYIKETGVGNTGWIAK